MLESAPSPETPDLSAWVGRSESAEDVLSPGPLAGLAALLDHENPPWPAGAAPPLAHWLYFLPYVRQSDIDADGHPKRGGFLPPVPLPRRMWAGGRLEFSAPLRRGATMHKRSTIASVNRKQGASGALVFVTVRHEIFDSGALCVSEEQDIVYRDAGGAAPLAKPESAKADVARALTLDPVQLFRFSALTFNAHRIHYDRAYARDVEGYAGLVAQGPFLAMLLMDHFLRAAPERRVRRFSFRAVQPLFAETPFELCLAWTDEGAAVWTRNAAGEATLRADIRAD